MNCDLQTITEPLNYYKQINKQRPLIYFLKNVKFHFCVVIAVV